MCRIEVYTGILFAPSFVFSFDLTLSQGLSLALLSFPFLFKMIKLLLQSSVLCPEAFVFFLEPLSDVLQGDISLDLALFIRLDTGLELR